MLLSAVSVLVVAQSISEIPDGLMNTPVLSYVACPDLHYFSTLSHKRNDFSENKNVLNVIIFGLNSVLHKGSAQTVFEDL